MVLSQNFRIFFLRPLKTIFRKISKTFLISLLNNLQVYVKGRKSFIESDPNEQLFWSKDSRGKNLLPDFGTFEEMVNSFLKHNLDVDLKTSNDDVFDKLWDYPIRDTVQSNNRNI